MARSSFAILDVVVIGDILRRRRQRMLRDEADKQFRTHSPRAADGESIMPSLAGKPPEDSAA
jgi:hypothetical protein